KKAAAAKALEWVKDGMTIGLGTGSTAYHAIEGLAGKMALGLKFTTVSSSLASESLAKGMGIPTSDPFSISHIDLAIDGADEVDDHGFLIKGGGGALTREKILSYNSSVFIVIVDSSKQVQQIGSFPLPVEVVPFASQLTAANLEKLGCVASLRQRGGLPFVTDNGNHILDCSFGNIAAPFVLAQEISRIPGVVEHGLFMPHPQQVVIIGSGDGSVIVRKKNA
ncbi:MAG TPA: ribose-5-phosphate isomerase RpiA, partial [Flavisolibacter sp.]|nr:ribose-5-phosphate isomerase RpiA [Flavisolibacter sp.]